MKTQSLRIPMFVSVVMVVLGVLAAFGSGARTRAQSNASTESKRTVDSCSNETIRGDYGFRVDGQILAGPIAGVLRGLAMTHFDGEGNLTQVDFSTINGVPRSQNWRPVVGTYSVNGNCTGTAKLIPSDGSPSINLRLIVVRNGREIDAIVEGNATGSIGIRRD